MKKNILSLFVVAVMIMGFATACGGGASNSPGEAAKKFSELFADGKIDKALEMVQGYSEASEEDKEKFKMLFKEAHSQLEEKEGVKSIEIVKEEINEAGDEAEVTLKTVYGNGEEEESTSNLVKVDGKWKIAMDK